MAEVLGLISSIGAILQITATVVQYIGDVKDSSKDRLKIRDEIASTSFLVSMLNDRIAQAKTPGEGDGRLNVWLTTVLKLGDLKAL